MLTRKKSKSNPFKSLTQDFQGENNHLLRLYKTGCNASAVKTYNATNSLVGIENKNIFFH
jgi:hypothetical protein